jgi:predicted GNAT family acetyltransferase
VAQQATQVQHDAARQRFVADVDGVEAELDYEQHGQLICLTHTGVPPAIGGRGIAADLVRTALEYARSKGLKVKPACTYAAAYIERHPQYADLVAE